MARTPKSGFLLLDDEPREGIISIPAPTKGEKWVTRVLVLLGLISLVIFVGWFINPGHVGYAPLYYLLTFALGFRLLRLLHEWYHYLGISVPNLPPTNRQWTVDMITTFCPGEPYDMIEQTLVAMKAVTYPHETYLCDEGNDPFLIKLCAELGVHHIYRGPVKTNAKAGNVNYCLENHARGEIVVIMDPDHEPIPQFLDRVLGFFEDPRVGYAQCVQAYYNRDESLVARGAAEQTYHFYGPMMMSMNTYGTAQAIGANCTFRRAALDSIGGHAPGLSEDMHTAMQLHAKGWKSIYTPEMLTRGLAPATISAYYKQQLKWSRGTFELLFTVYPKLLRHFTWQQAIHYLTIPLYFLYGLIGFIDLMVPMLSLGLALVPWHVNLVEFAQLVTPMLVMSLLIRQYAQRWLLEEHERGFHVMGGLLIAGTWWIFLIGLIYTFLRIKVPYIPTPKNDEVTDEVGVSMPNIVVALLCVVAVVYGLSIDWTPYSIGMAGFALFNALIMGFVGFLGMQRTINHVHARIGEKKVVGLIRGRWWRIRHKGIYTLLRNSSLGLALVLLFLISSFSFIYFEIQIHAREFSPPPRKNTGVFYAGLTTSVAKLPDLESYFPEKSLPQGMNLIGLRANQGEESLLNLDTMALDAIRNRGDIPVLKWQPFGQMFSQLQDTALLQIYTGQWDPYLDKCVEKIQRYHDPIFLIFAPEPENIQRGWGPVIPVNSEHFREVWEYVYAYFLQQGVDNVTWVWMPGAVDQLERYYPGDNLVDWIALENNFAQTSLDKDWYEPYRQNIAQYPGMANRPVMLMNNARVQQVPNVEEFRKTVRDLQREHPEIQGWLLTISDSDGLSPRQGLADNLSAQEVNALLQEQALATPVAAQAGNMPYEGPFRSTFASEKSSKVEISGSPGKYRLMVDGEPFFMKGVVYNLVNNWRDGDYPLTRSRLIQDFDRITEMGGNVIRRYKPSIYDHNVLQIAHEKNIKVVYGFWFDVNVDYLTDTAQVEAYMREVEYNVEKYKDYPAVLSWELGSGTYHYLRDYYGQPYLLKVRRAYLQMVERMAKRIHEIDPNHPVFKAAEDSGDLPSAIRAIKEYCPSVDGIGFNTFYEEETSRLKDLMATLYPERPYFLSEFGPKGHVSAEYSNFVNGYLLETTSYEKARQYVSVWEKHIVGNEGLTLGGFAYCWQDRLSGSAVWYGITDNLGRYKPAYYAIRSAWKDQKLVLPMENLYLLGPPARVQPGELCYFSAVTANPDEKAGYSYEWYICKESYLQRIDILQKFADGKRVKLIVPDEYSSYRVYLHITDNKGNVVTASAPLQIQWPPEQ